MTNSEHGAGEPVRCDICDEDKCCGAYYESGDRLRVAAISALQAKVADLERARGICVWIPDEEMECWESSCGEAFSFADGDPKANDYKFCPNCGEALRPDQGDAKPCGCGPGEACPRCPKK